MDKESRKYTLLYASGLVIFVSFILAFTAETLKDRQIANRELDKMKQILLSVNVVVNGKEVEDKYKELITETFLIDSEGNKVEGDAFAINMKNEMSLPAEKRKLPVYVAQIDGKKKYILEMTGTGLWGAIWGQIALEEDRNTIFGANIEHDSETPGLGAEVHTIEFAQTFIGKKLFNTAGDFVSVAVVKPGESHAGRDYVDGISGGTITSHAVDAMMFRSLGAYVGFLTKGEQ